MLIILFVLAIGSTAGFLYLLSQRSPVQTLSPSATNTVIVSPTGSAVAASAVASSASPAAQMSASAEWKTATSSALSLKIEYPADWTMGASDSAHLAITAPAQSVVIDVRRDKKESSSQKLATFVSARGETYKKDEYAMKEEKSTSVDDYTGSERLYAKESVVIREVVFTTKNYFYTVTITPGQGELTPVFNDILKSIHIQ